MRPCRGAEALG